MSVIKYRVHIIEAIDQLRRRKARPDRDRICSYVLRRFGVDNRSTIADLERLVDEEVVIKVEYKGNISYRNAATWSKLSVHRSRIEVELSDLARLESTQDETDRMSFVLRVAISELVCKEPDFLDTGVPVFELEQYLQTKDSEFFSRISFNVLLSREARAGTVVKLDNGNYLLGSSTMCGSSPSGSEDGARADRTMSPDNFDNSTLDKSPKGSPKHLSGESEPEPASEPDPEPQHEDHQEPELEPEPQPEPEPAPEISASQKDEEGHTGYRKGERRKRAKKVFDPSDNNLPKAKRRGRPSASHEKLAKPSPVSVKPSPVSTKPSPVSTKPSLVSTKPSPVSTKPPPVSVKPSPVPNISTVLSASSTLTVNGQSSRREDRSSKETKTSTTQNSRLNSLGISPTAVCAICISSIADGKAVSCKDCTKKAHMSCLIKGNRARFRPNTWQCMSCKTCQICSMTESVGTVVLCVNCDDGYHIKCHNPKPSMPWKKWMCYRCSPSDTKPPTPEKPKTAVSRDSVSPIMLKLPNHLLPRIEEMEVDDGPVDESVPDASDWTTDDVFKFFSEKYPLYADVFRDQEIDGRSLLLMTRSDVINGLKLKLGPALKIYCQVKKLQLRRSDSHLFWE